MPSSHKNIFIFNTATQMAEHAVTMWMETAGKAIHECGRFNTALSGGGTPVPVYERLSTQKGIEWHKVHIFMVDERFVPYESDENNYRMISQTLLRHVDIPARNIHPILTTEYSARKSAEKYEAELKSHFKTAHREIPRFDLILLGMGADGHTASLFPESPALKETAHMSVASGRSDRTEQDRITITLPVINNAENVIFMVTGAGKAKTVKEVVEAKESVLPAAAVRPHDGSLLFLLDREAGRLLSTK